MTSQIAARSLTEAQFLHQVGIAQTSILQILDRFVIAGKLRVEKGGGFGEQFEILRQSDVLFQTGETFAEGEGSRKALQSESDHRRDDSRDNRTDSCGH